MQRVLQRLIQLVIRLPWITVIGAVALAASALWYTHGGLEFETSRHALASSSARYVQLEDALDREFDRVSYLVVVIAAPTPELGKAYVEALATRLRADRQHVKDVVEKIDSSSLQGKKLLYLSPDELRDLRQRLADTREVMVGLAATPGLQQLLNAINQKIAKAFVRIITGNFLQTTPSVAASDATLDVGFLTALFTEMQRALATPATYRFHSPWQHFFIHDDDVFNEAGYLTSEHDHFFFVLVDGVTQAGSFVEYAPTLRAIRRHLQAMHDDFPTVNAGVTGEDALNTDEMLAARRDTLIATIIALIGVAILFIIAFRQLWRPLLVVVTLIVSVCWTLGFTTLAVGHLNILTVAFMPILIGLGIDFGIHIVARYGEERARQLDFETAIRAAYRHTGPGLVAAALTTSVAFYAVTLTNLEGLIELGLIAGSGLLLCLLASLTVLPALIALYERHRQLPVGVWQSRAARPSWYGRLPFPRTLLSLLSALTLAGVLLLPLPRFDYNLLNLQAQGTESVIWEHRLLAESDRSSLHVVTSADSLAALYQKEAQFSALPAVGRVESLASIMPADQDARLPLIKALAPYVADLSVDGQGQQTIDVDAIQLLLRKIRFKLQRQASEWDAAKRPSEAQLDAARQALIGLQRRLQQSPSAAAQRALATFQHALLRDIAAKLRLLQRNVDPTPITLADVPSHLRQNYVGKHGRYLLQVFSRDPMWERQAMRDFVTQVQTVDARVTGSPMIAYYSIQQIQHGYRRGGIYALIAIIGIVWLLFRRPKAAFLALIPLLFGGLWTVTLMAVMGLRFNLANLIIVPLFLGIAVDNGIHLVHRWREDPSAVNAPLARSTGKAIVLTSLTSMVGFGSLMLAHHAGVFSLGLLTTLAMGCSLLASLVVLPLVARLLPLARRPVAPQNPIIPVIAGHPERPHRRAGSAGERSGQRPV